MNKTYNKEDIIEDFRNLQMQFPEKQLTRSEYRKDGQYSTSLIEKMFGSWTKFVNEVGFIAKTNRHEIEKDSYSQKVIISSIIDGIDINEDVLNSLIACAKWNNAELYLFWTKSPKKGKYGLSLEIYNTKIRKFIAVPNTLSNKTYIVEFISISLIILGIIMYVHKKKHTKHNLN